MRFPDVIDKVLVASSFLSANSPFILPANQEMEARKAHHRFRDLSGDFGTYLNLFNAFKQTDNRERFCKKNYLDERVMAEIENIHFQLAEIVGEQLKMPVIENGGKMADYLCCIAAGMIQFVCIRNGRESYRSLTADHICIHPGSVMFRQDPVFIVAGEIVKTSRIFAMSVSPLTRPMLDTINPKLYERLISCKKQKLLDSEQPVQKTVQKNLNPLNIKNIEDALSLGGVLFETKKIKGKKTAILPYEYLLTAIRGETDQNKLKACSNLKGIITTKDHGTIMEGEKLGLIIPVASSIDLNPIPEKKWNRKMNANIHDPVGKEQIIFSLDWILRTAIAKQKNREYGFICLFTNGNGDYWYKVSRGFMTALTETHASLETLVEENVDFTYDETNKINDALRIVNNIYTKL